MGDGEQVVVMPVTLVPLLVEPQAANHNTPPTTSKSLNLRILLVSLTDVAGFHTLRYQLRNVSLAMKASRMSGLLDYQARRFDGDGRTAPALPLLGGLLRLLIVWAQQLLQIRRELPFPNYAEDRSTGRDVLTHDAAGRRSDLVHHVGFHIHAAQGSLHPGLVVQHRGGAVAQNRPGRERQDCEGAK